LLTLREESRLRVSENRVLRRIFGPKRDEVISKWRRLHNDELNDLYSSLTICSGDQIDNNEMGGACSAYGGEGRCIQVLVGNLRERDHLENPGIEGKIILRRIFWTGSSWLKIGADGGLL
jgi:hypothetical protein